MLKQQFIDLIKQPSSVENSHLAELENLIKEYPFFETAHLLYTKGLHKYNAIHYSKQLRKTAIVVNNRSVLYELLHQPDAIVTKQLPTENVEKEVKPSERNDEPIVSETVRNTSPVTVTNDEVKVIYINTVSNSTAPAEREIPVAKEISDIKKEQSEIDIVKDIENETEAPSSIFDEEKLNNEIESEINRGIIQSYVETSIIKTPDLHKEESMAPASFTDWLHKVKKEGPTIQPQQPEEIKNHEKTPNTAKKTSFFDQNRQIIDKIIESDPGRIKLGSNKFFTPSTDAKQSLLENEHLVTETLAKIYALQGNISKAIRAYEILSLKFPQKSVYFASLIEKLKTNK